MKKALLIGIPVVGLAVPVVWFVKNADRITDLANFMAKALREENQRIEQEIIDMKFEHMMKTENM